MPNEESIINWFHVKNSQEARKQPMYIEHTIKGDLMSENVQRKLEQLVHHYKSFEQKTNFEDVWRYAPPIQPNVDASKPKIVVQPLTKLEKLRKSIESRLPRSNPLEKKYDPFLNHLVELISTNWKKI